ncbi:cysteine desulfurase family protein [Exiguobacterium sp. SL14]|nr:cysteine desulfurase family protein [Exiguobacterium sp. SL14]MCY1690444.1 cysteine desulfurase family protein [Exiguobacterium sp. SL14]
MNYFDHSATTPMRPEVLAAMTPYLLEQYGNPSSVHAAGRSARATIDQARLQIAHELNAKPTELIFTSGGTESDNYAIFGAAEAAREKGRHLITTRFEHHAVLRAFEELEKQGYDVTYLDVPSSGVVSLNALQEAVREDTTLVSIMFGNNEVGTIQPIAAFGRFLRERGILFHTDAVQVFGKQTIDVEALQVDLLSASGHKINGPKGIGLLYVRNRCEVSASDVRWRTGTQASRWYRKRTGVVGLAKALELMIAERDQQQDHIKQLRTILLKRLDESGVNYEINGEEGLPNVLNLYFPQIEIEPFLIMLDMRQMAVSSGSACTAGSVEPSHVLSAMYGEDERTRASVRISFGHGNDISQVELLAQALQDVVKSFQN